MADRRDQRPGGSTERHQDHVEYMLRQLSEQVRTNRTLLVFVLRGLNIMSAEMDALEAEVARNTSVDSSALVLIQSILDKLAAAGTDAAKLTKLRTDLAASSDALAAAVAANTTPPPA